MYCPYCGKVMINLKDELHKYEYVCRDSNCRCCVNNNKISTLTLDMYAKLYDFIKYAIEKEDNNSSKYFMLLKKNSDTPMLVKNTNSIYEKNKQSLSIIQCKNKEEALEVFRSKFNVLKITLDMIVEIKIRREN